MKWVAKCTILSDINLFSKLSTHWQLHNDKRGFSDRWQDYSQINLSGILVVKKHYRLMKNSIDCLGLADCYIINFAIFVLFLHA